jgi:hypothetical protein
MIEHGRASFCTPQCPPDWDRDDVDPTSGETPSNKMEQAQGSNLTSDEKVSASATKLKSGSQRGSFSQNPNSLPAARPTSSSNEPTSSSGKLRYNSQPATLSDSMLSETEGSMAGMQSSDAERARSVWFLKKSATRVRFAHAHTQKHIYINTNRADLYRRHHSYRSHS